MDVFIEQRKYLNTVKQKPFWVIQGEMTQDGDVFGGFKINFSDCKQDCL